MLHMSVSISLSFPDRSQQLFGPCLFSSAYQHALVPVINIGECRFPASFSSRFSRHVIPGSSWIARSPAHSLNCLISFFPLPLPQCWQTATAHRGQFSASLSLLLLPPVPRTEVPTLSLSLSEDHGDRNWTARRRFIQQHRDKRYKTKVSFCWLCCQNAPICWHVLCVHHWYLCVM